MTAAARPRPAALSGRLVLDQSRLERTRLVLLFVMMLGGAFVFTEPSPYEIGALAAIGAFVLTGAITVHAAHVPLIATLLVYCIGLTVGALPVLGAPKVAPWVAVSWYLAVTALFFAIILRDNTAARLSAVIRGWTWAAVIAALAGIAGYFRLVPGGFELFTLYGRAKGTFNDPNVFAPFLVLPILVALQAFFLSGAKAMARSAAVLAILVLGMLLSFSRGAWVHLVVSAAIMVALMMATASSAAARLRIAAVVGIGLVAVLALIAVLLSLDTVADLMRERASLNQSYDSGPMGRFGRHAYGWQLALDRPLGIGPLQFPRFFPEDPHNVYLNAFMAGGWTAGIAYLVFVGLTLFVGLGAALRSRPWRPTAIAVVATFVGVALEGQIIDTDHWRHFWVLAGLLWGLALANRVAGAAESA